MTPWILVTGLTLIHFVWQGALVALATAAGLRLVRRHSPEARYLVACAGLTAMLAAPVLTATRLSTAPDTFGRAGSGAIGDRAAQPAVQTLVPSTTSTADPSAAPTATSSIAIDRLDAWLFAVVCGWLGGVLLLSGRLAGGCWRVHRLRTASISERVSQWQAAGERIARQLRVDVAFRVVETTLVDAPSVIGWIRPVIVLPAAALTNLAPAQIEAILAHELAHVRRRDYAVNLLQMVAETVLFYHPGIWWVSARIREEREHCCDDVAVGLCGEPVVYAAALEELASWRAREAAPAVGASDGSLIRRIRRVLGVPRADDRRSMSGLVAIVLGLLVFVGAAVQSSSPAGGPQPRGENWRKLDTDHFELHYQADLDFHAERVGREAEQAYQRVSSDLKHELGFRVPLMIYRTSNELGQGVQGGRLAGPSPASFAELSRDRILIAVDRPADQWSGLITHELAHVFGFDIIPGSTTAPWILEGLAEYARGAWDPGDLVALRDAIRANRIPAIERLDGDATGFGEATGIGQRLTWGLGHAAFDFIESRWGKAGVRQFLFGLRRAALEGGDPYELGLRMPRHEFGRAFEQYLKERFTGSPLQLRDDRFDSSDTLRIEGEITTIATPASAGLACLQLSAVEDGSRRKWAVECGEGAGDKLLPALKPGDRVIVTGPPARKPATERLLMRSLVRPADGFTWPARPQ